MSRTRLINRLKWYYPTERFHTYVTFPVIMIYLLFTNEINDIILLMYGMIICTVILFQGQHYWKLKLSRLEGGEIDQEKNINFFEKSKRRNWILISIMLPVLIIQLYIQEGRFNTNDMFLWGVLANIFAILENLNYYYIQLMIDNKYDVQYVIRNRRLKKSSLAKDLVENRI